MMNSIVFGEKLYFIFYESVDIWAVVEICKMNKHKILIVFLTTIVTRESGDQ